MHKRVQEMVKYAEACGFEMEGKDGNEHYVMRHPNGERLRIACTPGDFRGDRNNEALARRLSGVIPPRANSGSYRRGIRRERYVPASVRVDSRSHKIANMQRRFRELCERIDWCREEGDIEGASSAIAELFDMEKSFQRLGVRPPVRSFRVY